MHWLVHKLQVCKLVLIEFAPSNVNGRQFSDLQMEILCPFNFWHNRTNSFFRLSLKAIKLEKPENNPNALTKNQWNQRLEYLYLFYPKVVHTMKSSYCRKLNMVLAQSHPNLGYSSSGLKKQDHNDLHAWTLIQTMKHAKKLCGKAPFFTTLTYSGVSYVPLQVGFHY